MNTNTDHCSLFHAIEVAAAPSWPGLKLRCRSLTYVAPDDGRVVLLRRHEGTHLGSLQAPGLPTEAELRVQIVFASSGRYTIYADLDGDDQDPIADKDTFEPDAEDACAAFAENLIARLRTMTTGAG